MCWEREEKVWQLLKDAEGRVCRSSFDFLQAGGLDLGWLARWRQPATIISHLAGPDQLNFLEAA